MTKKKVLFVSHTANFSKFNRPYMRWFKDIGFEVHYASMGEEIINDCDRHFNINFERSPFSLKNISAYKQLNQVIDSQNYSIIHCHTPVGGVVARLASRKARKLGTKVIYTAHGFHFFDGAPKKYWLMFYPVEKFLARYLDCLITINDEDYKIAKDRFKAKRVEKVSGVGVDLARFSPSTLERKRQLRQDLGYSQYNKILICIAEFTENKNQELIIKSAKNLIETIPNLKVLFAGVGAKMNDCKKLVDDLGLQDRIDFLGYRTDVEKLYAISDVAVSASNREGLAVNILESMATGLPVVCTNVRGHKDMVKDKINGLLFNPNDGDRFEAAIRKIFNDNELLKKISKQNVIDVQPYSLEKSLEKMKSIYESVGNIGLPLRVLQVVTIMNRSGLETMLMNYYRNVDRQKVQFDFLVHREMAGDYDQEIRSLGGNIYKLPALKISNIFRYCRAIKAFFNKHTEYNIVHSHLDALSAIPLSAAKKARIPRRIAHCHVNGFNRDWKALVRWPFKHFIKFYATDFAGCSTEAIRYMFGKKVKKFQVIYNAFDLKDFKYDIEKRQKTRRSLGIENETVIGHVGRFDYPKNHEYLINIFAKFKKLEPQSKLLLVGSGKIQNKIKHTVNQLGFNNDVMFLGSRSDIPDLLQAMDVFVMPSRYEGLGLALIEAQAAGLRCLASDVVPKSAKVTDLLSYMSLKQKPDVWARKIQDIAVYNHASDISAITKAGYDIHIESKNLEQYYLDR